MHVCLPPAAVVSVPLQLDALVSGCGPLHADADALMAHASRGAALAYKQRVFASNAHVRCCWRRRRRR